MSAGCSEWGRSYLRCIEPLRQSLQYAAVIRPPMEHGAVWKRQIIFTSFGCEVFRSAPQTGEREPMNRLVQSRVPAKHGFTFAVLAWQQEANANGPMGTKYGALVSYRFSERVLCCELRRPMRNAHQRTGSKSASGKGGIMKSLVNFKAFLQIVMFAILLPIPLVSIAQTSDPEAISKLLRQAKAHAALIQDEALILESYSRSGLAWQIHAIGLNNIRRDANKLIADMSQLHAMREKGTRSQREAIDRISPRVQSMAVDLNTTIRTLNHGHGTVNMPPFRERVHANRVQIDEIYSMICRSVNRNYEI